MKTENDIRLQYKKDTGTNALEFGSSEQHIEIKTDELRYFQLCELEQGLSISIECKIEMDDEKLE